MLLGWWNRGGWDGTGHAACMGERNVYKVVVGNLNWRDHLEELIIHRRIILKEILKEM